MDQYIKDVLDSRKQLMVEDAVDEHIQAGKELIVETTTVVDKFIDNTIEELSGDELDALIDGEDADIEAELADLEDPIDYTDGEMSDIDTVLDTEPEVMTLDFDDEEVQTEGVIPSIDKRKINI
jgi:hypothetical protein